MNRYEFRVGPYTCVPLSYFAVGGVYLGAVRVSLEGAEAELVQYPDRSFHAPSDARAYAKRRFTDAHDSGADDETNG